MHANIKPTNKHNPHTNHNPDIKLKLKLCPNPNLNPKFWQNKDQSNCLRSSWRPLQVKRSEYIQVSSLLVHDWTFILLTLYKVYIQVKMIDAKC